MSLSIGEANNLTFAQFMPVLFESRLDACREVYEQNRHRVYSLAFWMTDNELVAEELMTQTFTRAFAQGGEPSADDVDRALLAELHEYVDFQPLSLQCTPATKVISVRYNTMRVDLERAVVQLPATEKMIFLMHDVERYNHTRIANLLGITEDESCQGLHQARLRMRELLAN